MSVSFRNMFSRKVNWQFNTLGMTRQDIIWEVYYDLVMQTMELLDKLMIILYSVKQISFWIFNAS